MKLATPHATPAERAAWDAAHQPASQTRENCRFCYAELPAAGQFCPDCGAQFEWTPEPLMERYQATAKWRRALNTIHYTCLTHTEGRAQ